MNEKLEKLNRQKTAAEKKLIAAQHREKQLEHELKRLTRSERTHLRTPPQQCSLTADDGASLPLEWCMATGGVVHRAAMLRTTRGCPCVCAWIHPQSGWYRRCR